MIFIIEDLPTWKAIQEEALLTAPVFHSGRYCKAAIPAIKFNIIINLKDKINAKSKQEFIHSFLSLSMTHRVNHQKLNYYNIFIKYLSYSHLSNQICSISEKILFTNTCQILHYKINNNLYNLYNFVSIDLVNDFNIQLVKCLLIIYYLYYDYLLNPHSNEINQYEVNENERYQYLGFASNEFLKLFLFPLNPELPINLELSELKIQINELHTYCNESKLQINELKLELFKIKEKYNEYIEVD